MSTIRGIVAENDVYDESVVMEKGLTPYILFRFGVGKVESRQEKHSDIPKEHYFYSKPMIDSLESNALCKLLIEEGTRAKKLIQTLGYEQFQKARTDSQTVNRISMSEKEKTLLVLVSGSEYLSHTKIDYHNADHGYFIYTWQQDTEDSDDYYQCKFKKNTHKHTVDYMFIDDPKLKRKVNELTSIELLVANKDGFSITKDLEC